MDALLRILKGKWISPPKDVNESYAGRNVIVTGATSGVGYAAAAKFAFLGASKVIICARDIKKGEKTKDEIIKAKLGTQDQLEVWELDMNAYESVVAFANRANELDHLDIAVLNAGVRRDPFTLSGHGWEEDLQVNVLSTTLLGVLLLPKLKQSKEHTGKIPTLEFVNSGLHQKAQIASEVIQSPSILQEYNQPKQFSAQRQYSHTKLLLMFATNKLAEATSSGEVIVTSVCPGMVKTDLGRDVKFPGVSIALAIIAFLLMRTPEQGANTYLSGTAQNEQLHGRFWQDDVIRPIGQSIAGEENKAIGLRVWNEIVETLSRDVPSFKEALSAIMP
jgi:NAD(P)-dependent dehydrogenase (short-subunit alcohol dehydrogenase family)